MEPRVDPQRPRSFSKILVPTDFSKGAELAIARALELRQAFGATLTLLHTYQLPLPYSDVGWVSTDATAAYEEAAQRELSREEDAALRACGRLGCADPRAHITAKLASGYAPQLIVDEAARGGYDLIVMGTHGRSGLSRLWLGSVAERVVRTATCPVLTVRQRG